jgi:hypothetical protein
MTEKKRWRSLASRLCTWLALAVGLGETAAGAQFDNMRNILVSPLKEDVNAVHVFASGTTPFDDECILTKAHIYTYTASDDRSLFNFASGERLLRYFGDSYPPYKYYPEGYRLRFSYRSLESSSLRLYPINGDDQTLYTPIALTPDGKWHTIDIPVTDLNGEGEGAIPFTGCASLDLQSNHCSGTLLTFRTTGNVWIDSLFFYTYDFLVDSIFLSEGISNPVQYGSLLGDVTVKSKLPYPSAPVSVFEYLKIECDNGLPLLSSFNGLVSAGAYPDPLEDGFSTSFRIVLPAVESIAYDRPIRSDPYSINLRPRQQRDGREGHSFRPFWIDDTTYGEVSVSGASQDFRPNETDRPIRIPDNYLFIAASTATAFETPDGLPLRFVRTSGNEGKEERICFNYPMSALPGDAADWYLHMAVRTTADIAYTVILRDGERVRSITVGNRKGAGGQYPTQDFAHNGSWRFLYIPLSSFAEGSPVAYSDNAALTILPVGDEDNNLVELDAIFLAKTHVDPTKIKIALRKNDGNLIFYDHVSLSTQGEGVQLVTLLEPDSARLSGSSIEWSCTDNGVVTLTPENRLKAQRRGIARVIASLRLSTGRLLTDTLDVDVRPLLVQEITLYEGEGAGSLVTGKTDGKPDTSVVYADNLTFRLQVHTSPQEADDGSVRWSIRSLDNSSEGATLLSSEEGDNIRTVKILPSGEGKDVIVYVSSTDEGNAAASYRIRVVPKNISIVDSEGNNAFTPPSGKDFTTTDITLKVVSGHLSQRTDLPVRWSCIPNTPEAIAFTDGIPNGGIASAERTLRILRPNAATVVYAEVEGPNGTKMTSYYPVSVPESELNIVRVDDYALANKANPGDTIKLIAVEPHAGLSGGCEPILEPFNWEASEGLTRIFMDTLSLYKAVHYRVDTASVCVSVAAYRKWTTHGTLEDQPHGAFTLEILPRPSLPLPPLDNSEEAATESGVNEDSEALNGGNGDSGESTDSGSEEDAGSGNEEEPDSNREIKKGEPTADEGEGSGDNTGTSDPKQQGTTPATQKPVSKPSPPTAVQLPAGTASTTSPSVNYIEGALLLMNLEGRTIVIASLTGCPLTSFSVSGKNERRPLSLPTGIYILYTYPSSDVVLKFVVQ